MFPKKFIRYILWDVLKIFALTLVGMTLVISLMFVGQTLFAEGLGYYEVLKLLPFIFLIALQYSVPPTLLFSVCCVYGRMSADNEIIALKGAGVSPMVIFRPAIVLGLLISLPSVWMIDMAFSWGQPQIQRIIMRSSVELIYAGLSRKRFYDTQKGLTVHVAGVEDRWLIKPNIWINSNNQWRTITAEKARISIDPSSDKLLLELQDSFININDSKRITEPGLTLLELPLDFASKKDSGSIRPSEYSMAQIPDELQKQRTENEQRRQKLATRFAVSLASGKYAEIYDGTVHTQKYFLDTNEKRLIKLQTEPMRRWALGFSCLAFVWMGVPMAILIKSADYWWTFGVCFIPTLAIYYPLFGMALEFAKDGRWPTFGLWLGNVTLVLIGSWLMRRVVKT
jgi:lipopolysaccharide export system permease protein